MAQLLMVFHIPGNAYAQTDYSPTGNVVLESSYGNSPTPYLFGTLALHGITMIPLLEH